KLLALKNKMELIDKEMNRQRAISDIWKNYTELDEALEELKYLYWSVKLDMFNIQVKECDFTLISTLIAEELDIGFYTNLEEKKVKQIYRIIEYKSYYNPHYCFTYNTTNTSKMKNKIFDGLTITMNRSKYRWVDDIGYISVVNPNEIPFIHNVEFSWL